MWGIMAVVLLAVSAYLLGSVLWADLVSRRYGVNIWSIDTNNPGAGNVARNVGVPQAIFVYVADVITAAAVMLVAGALPHALIAQALGAAAVLAGTFFSAFHNFHGGTGLAKGMGLLLGLNPAGFFVGAPLGIITIYWLKNPALSGGLMYLVTVLYSYLVYHDAATAGLIILTGLAVLVRARILARHQHPRAA